MDDATSAANETAAAFDRVELSARLAGRSMQAALAMAGAEGRKLEDVLRSVGTRLGEMVLQSAGQATASLLGGALPQALTGVLSGFSGGGSAPVSSALASGAPGVAQAARPMSIVMNVTTPDAESFKRSEAQVSAALARAVSRGARAS